ncbi:MAG: S24/S26 family peptidase [Proteobacteria bacterium]|nr:S24/S26 family peptidase [Pseudomonadota bacterium]
MIELEKDDLERIQNYKGFVMNGSDMSPAINEGDHLVVDLAQTFIISGDMYIVEYKESIVVCRLLLDRDKVKLIFDGASHTFDEWLKNITIIGRIIEVKSLVE